MDNRILSTIIDKFKGGPVGLTTIATAVGEQALLRRFMTIFDYGRLFNENSKRSTSNRTCI